MARDHDRGEYVRGPANHATTLVLQRDRNRRNVEQARRILAGQRPPARPFD